MTRFEGVTNAYDRNRFLRQHSIFNFIPKGLGKGFERNSAFAGSECYYSRKMIENKDSLNTMMKFESHYQMVR